VLNELAYICCPDILTIAILSVMAGEGGRTWIVWVSKRLVIDVSGSSQQDTEWYLNVDQKQFEDCFERWVKQLVNELGIQVIAVDGNANGR